MLKPIMGLTQEYRSSFENTVNQKAPCTNTINNKNPSQRKSNKMQQCIKILFHIYMKLNMFQATHRQSSGA
jgi:hypothetical protein